MKFDEPLLEGKFIKRYKRFFADIEYNGEIITAHCPNTGSMKGLKEEGSPCRFSFIDDPKRKLKYTLQQIHVGDTWVGVNTGLPNHLVFEAFEKKLVKHWSPFNGGRKEVKINDKSRIDLVLWKDLPEIDNAKKWNVDFIDKFKFHFIEVKNVTLAENGQALFPDAVTTRGQKHLEELMALIDRGHSCEIVFTIQRDDFESFSAAKDIDPEYAKLLKEAKKKGVIVTPLHITQSDSEVIVNPKNKVPVRL
ncbi:MAG: DNA/RNA nuclease SfsA [Bdellovibrionaceae bacterium]|nr:DNA/RNA nuclease SfsA [Pseudobdellovibrionaceae bacterium]|tara:strand:- start:133319 stop:134068 length:750 start_codon:yes stop_codon:yes gene_type:complete